MRRLDFFIAGVQKGGTSALDALLRRHPAIRMAGRKELHFFDNEKIDWRRPDLAALHRGFDWSLDSVVRGEATPIYTYWPRALERIARYNPAARLIVGLRHPVLRAFSHWRMETVRGAETLSFSCAIREGRARVASAPRGVHRVFSYVERGFYAPQIRRAGACAAAVHCLRTDRLWSDPATELAAIARFLGVDAAERAAPVGYVVPVDSSRLPPISEEDRAYLLDLYAPDIAETGRMTGLDLSDWLRPGYREPMAPAGG